MAAVINQMMIQWWRRVRIVENIKIFKKHTFRNTYQTIETL